MKTEKCKNFILFFPLFSFFSFTKSSKTILFFFFSQRNQRQLQIPERVNTSQIPLTRQPKKKPDEQMRNCCHLGLVESEIPNKDRSCSSFFIAFFSLSFSINHTLHSPQTHFPSYWLLGVNQNCQINERIDSKVCSKEFQYTNFVYGGICLLTVTLRDRERKREKRFKQKNYICLIRLTMYKA